MHQRACYGLRWTPAGLQPAAERRAFLPRALAAASAAFLPLHRADRGQAQGEKINSLFSVLRERLAFLQVCLLHAHVLSTSTSACCWNATTSTPIRRSPCHRCL